MKILQVCPPHLSDAVPYFGKSKKVIFNSIIHTKVGEIISPTYIFLTIYVISQENKL